MAQTANQNSLIYKSLNKLPICAYTILIQQNKCITYSVVIARVMSSVGYSEHGNKNYSMGQRPSVEGNRGTKEI